MDCISDLEFWFLMPEILILENVVLFEGEKLFNHNRLIKKRKKGT